MSNSKEYFIGIDGGGTKCKVRLEDAEGNLLAEAITGPANVARDLNGSMQSILQATDMAIATSGICGLTPQSIHAGIGLAGLNIPEVMKAFKEKTLPFASSSITSDLHIACLGAHKQDNSAIVIVGTGSSGIFIKGNVQFELGGHGFAIGDKGSGAWLGKMAITHCLEVLDGIKSKDELTTEILSFFNCKNAHQLVTLTLDAKPAFYAGLAPLILVLAAKNEPYAKYLIIEAADYINKLSKQLFKLKPARFSLIGGITHILIPYLAPELQTQIQEPIGSPEQGAILYSKYQLTHREN
ncbi:BadF/BadG/BcrA/BcrD ATPase family protein [Pseudocolwellia sp. HL-MZ19]|uniref:BadF/BadG/BcrA/BcrD ATPase family protein n=1 Tax=Pseudocolwellia sp. HL-MZ19 TaxID=3400846 RepID=UPI003CF2F117